MASKSIHLTWTHTRCAGLAALVASAVLAASCGGGGSTDPRAQFTAMGLLPGYPSSAATAVAFDGSAVAGYADDGAGHGEAFRWTAAGGMTGIGNLAGGTSSRANAISRDGSVIVGTGNTTANPPASAAAFRWTAAGGMQRVEPLAGGLACAGAAVSGDGATVAGVCLVNGNVGFRWTQAGGAVGLGQFGPGMSSSSNASSISLDAAVIGGAGDPRLVGAMLWPAGGLPFVMGRPAPDDQSASVSALSHDGAVAVGISVDAAGASHMFRWTANTGMSILPGLPGSSGELVGAISGDGATVVGWSQSGSLETALIWDAAQGTRPLATELVSRGASVPAGWSLSRAQGISGDGRTIAGQGIDPQGHTQSWVIRLSD